LEVLRLIVASTNASDGPVRQAAAVHFKNIIKKGWDTESEHGTDGIVITDTDRGLIKSHLVQFMCTMPPQIQAQCSEAISIIAAVDFPSRWENLLPELVGQFSSPDIHVVNGVLLTANSILKRFRYAQRSDGLYKVILYVLEKLQAPLLSLFVAIGEEVERYRNDKARLGPYFMALRTMCRIFYSLNYQDLPEYFEDHMAEWMGEFSKYLEYVNPLLSDEEEEQEASPIDTLQAAIVQNLYLYADKDEETFLPYLSNFTRSIWNLLMRVSQFPKHDTLATTCIRFLSSLVGKLMHKHLFQEENTLRQIMTSIVIPNLVIRDID
jgi:exportin-2 (importin alpha re-exporter)